MSKNIILGTAGHIDHGKTSLIKALTGIDTDRLKEEKMRGITIELGFAWLDIPNGQRLGIIDVPGHEKFIKNMVAGATGIDIVMMVIAADEGVMPQTREHMDICSLLDIKYGLVALTKVDTVDEDWLTLVEDDIRNFVKGSFLENAPIVRVSSVTRHGLPELVNTLNRLYSEVDDHTNSSIFRLPVDRVFTMKGFGTVITGTQISGKVCVGDQIMIYPSGITSKVRGIQVHNVTVDQATAGMRTAINVQGLEKDSVIRGDVASHVDSLASTRLVDIKLQYLKSNIKPLKNRTQVRFHAGTSEILGYVVLLDREELLPGETGYAQMRLQKQIALIKNDRFVIRSYSPVKTVGGGFVLNPLPIKTKRLRDNLVSDFDILSSHDNQAIISLIVTRCGYSGVSFEKLLIMTDLTDKQLSQIIQAMLSERKIILIDKDSRLYINQVVLDEIKSEISKHLSEFHNDNPLKTGMSKEELKSRFPSELSPKLFHLVLQQLVKQDTIAVEEDIVRLKDHKVKLKKEESEIRSRIEKAYLESGDTPPYFTELAKASDMDKTSGQNVLSVLVKEGVIVKVKDDLYYHRSIIDKLQESLVAYLKQNGQILPADFKSITGLSRKYLIPLLEYFDAKKVTIRTGDTRQLRSGSEAKQG